MKQHTADIRDMDMALADAARKVRAQAPERAVLLVRGDPQGCTVKYYIGKSPRQHYFTTFRQFAKALRETASKLDVLADENEAAHKPQGDA